MWRAICFLCAFVGLGLSALTAFPADSPKQSQVASSPIPARALGYDVPGEVHDDPTLPVRSIVYSDRKLLRDRDGQPEYELTYRVCNIDAGDQAVKRESAKLYFQWPDAGFRTALRRELPFEYCVKLVREVSAPIKQGMSDILYTYSPTAIPARSVWTMDKTPPWSKPERYWSYGVSLWEDFLKGQKNAQQMFRIHTTRKAPQEKGAYQLLGWRQGTEIYMVLPKLSADEMDRYRVSLGRLESQGVRFSIRPGEQAAQDFAQEVWVTQSFGSRSVLKIDRQPQREKENEFQQFQVEVPVSSTDLIELPAVLRERASGRALYEALYVTAGF